MKGYQPTLMNTFRLSYLRPSQEMLVTRILENAEAPGQTASITALPTGGGKSLCFLLPAVVLDEWTVLLYPLKSLMNDQARRLEEIGVPYSLLRGGMTREERNSELLSLERREKKILITNMEMLLYLTKSGALDFLISRIELFVMDEAHTIMQWKDGFRPSYQELGKVISYLRPHQALCFTATIDGEMKEGLKELLFKDVDTEEFTLSPDRDNVFYHRVLSLNKREDMRNILAPPERRPAVVFCHSRKECEEWHETFRGVFPSVYYHSGLPPETKKRLEKEFHDSKTGVIFATNAYGMGVDKKNIRTVIHTRLPEDPLSFLQESGRGGRDGYPFDSFVLISPGEEGPMKEIFLGESCIRNALLDALDAAPEADMCTACSFCSGDSYVPAGRNELVKALRRFPFLSRNALTKLLMNPVRKAKGLERWEEYEIKDALAYLRKEMRAKKDTRKPRHQNSMPDE